MSRTTVMKRFQLHPGADALHWGMAGRAREGEGEGREGEQSVLQTEIQAIHMLARASLSFPCIVFATCLGLDEESLSSGE
jgi:hypothetical protein